MIASIRGDSSFSELLRYLRFHTAFHYRQVRTFLAGECIFLPNAFNIDTLTDLGLPDAIY